MTSLAAYLLIYLLISARRSGVEIIEKETGISQHFIFLFLFFDAPRCEKLAIA